ncbi:MAG: helicase-related protein [Promethearchaeota archaeon]
MKKSDLFIVDNGDSEWKVHKYLSEWCEIAKKFDIATGFFEIGALLSLEGKWQKLEEIRILMGAVTSKRTQQAFNKFLSKINKKLDDSIEKEKEKNDFLKGVLGIVQNLENNKIKCKIYKKKKFHAKAYITHSKFDVVGSSALVGSSNFTWPGLNENIELNIQIRREVDELQEWFEKHWNEAEDITSQIIETVKRHTREYSPFEVYMKALYEFFKGHEMTESEWERAESKIYPILDQYQKEGYHALIKIAARYTGAFLCDGVGLGKTYIGLMLIERLVMRENKRVVLIVPKSARKPVWEAKIKKYIPEILSGFIPFRIINHTDLTRKASKDIDWPELMENVKKQAEVIIIDEAHHFRNLSTNRYKKLFDISENKQMYMLTATPINNSLLDLLHQIEIFTRKEKDHFGDAPLGIHNLRGHFLRLHDQLQRRLAVDPSDTGINVDDNEARDVLSMDDLFNAIVVQRSRSYVKKSVQKSGEREVLFPERKPPIVIDYSLKKTYGKLLDILKIAFDKDNPLLTLAIYYPLAYYIGGDETIDPMKEGRQKQIVGLIRTLLLKRFESSRRAFHYSCEDLLMKLFAFVMKYNESLAKRWENLNKHIFDQVKKHWKERGKIEEDDWDEDYFPEELLEEIEELDKSEYNISDIISETLADMTQLIKFLRELIRIQDQEDDKLEQLVNTLKKNELLQKNKVIIFSEYLATAQYLFEELKTKGFNQVFEIDGSTKRDRGEIITAFSPYYNDSSSLKLEENGKEEIRILISTDVLSEGLNLQDASLLINYDLHWNPVRLMQRIGRVDRRLDKEVEDKIIKDHPELKYIRGKVQYWNFLPPEELNDILSLYRRVTNKTLVISKTFGIQGKKLLTPEDDYEALREFNKGYEGTTTILEEMRLEYQELLKQNPELSDLLANYPSKVFSGKKHITPKAKAIFFCYLLPAKDISTNEWTEEAGFSKWYLYDLKTQRIVDEPAEIIEFIRSKKDTPRFTEMRKKDLITIREKLDNYIKNSYLKSVQAPIGVKPILKTWMELS